MEGKRLSASAMWSIRGAIVTRHEVTIYLSNACGIDKFRRRMFNDASDGLTWCWDIWRVQGVVSMFCMVRKGTLVGTVRGQRESSGQPRPTVSFPCSFPFSARAEQSRCVMGPHLSLPRCMLGTVIAESLRAHCRPKTAIILIEIEVVA